MKGWEKKIKKGDKVLCISKKYPIEEGKVYYCSKSEYRAPDGLFLIHLKGQPEQYYTHRFTKVETQLKFKFGE